MSNLTAAQEARTASAMERRTLYVNGVNYTLAEIVSSGRVAYVRTHIAADGKRSYGLILRERAVKAQTDTRFERFAEALYYIPFHEIPKLVADHLYTRGISRLVASPSDGVYVIQYPETVGS